MVKESTHGAMERYTMENGTKDLSMATEFGEDFTMIRTLVSGDTLKLKAMGCILGKMETDMRESGNVA